MLQVLTKRKWKAKCPIFQTQVVVVISKRSKWKESNGYDLLLDLPNFTICIFFFYSVCWKYNVLIPGIRLGLVLGLLNAVMPHIDFEAWEYAPNSRKTEAGSSCNFTIEQDWKAHKMQNLTPLQNSWERQNIILTSNKIAAL